MPILGIFVNNNMIYFLANHIKRQRINQIGLFARSIFSATFLEQTNIVIGISF